MADNQTIKKIKIWDHSDHKGNTKLLIADSGKLTVTADQHYLLLKLYNGGMYEESRPIEKSTNSGLDTKPFMRTLFKEQEIHFDLSSFKFDQTDEDLFKDHYKMLNLKQLNHALDSMTIEINKRKYELAGYITSSYLMSKQQHYDTLNTANINFSLKEWYGNLKPDQKTRLLSDAIRNANSLQGYATMIEREENYNNENMQRLSIEWHRKFTLSVACLILFFIGAPLGAIIKKGGLGTPMLFCIIFFLIYYIISMIGERSAREMAINPISGMWMSSMVLTPIAVFLLVKANRDSALLDREQYVKFFKKLFKLNKRAAA